MYIEYVYHQLRPRMVPKKSNFASTSRGSSRVRFFLGDPLTRNLSNTLRVLAGHKMGPQIGGWFTANSDNLNISRKFILISAISATLTKMMTLVVLRFDSPQSVGTLKTQKSRPAGRSGVISPGWSQDCMSLTRVSGHGWRWENLENMGNQCWEWFSHSMWCVFCARSGTISLQLMIFVHIRD